MFGKVMKNSGNKNSSVNLAQIVLSLPVGIFGAVIASLVFSMVFSYGSLSL